jgi:predicted phosphodiesterase
MKIHILSDLHLEFAPFQAPKTDADVVVLAGDIHLGQKGLEWAKQSFPDKTVLYVLGNHEYYGNAIPKLVNQLHEQAAGTQVHILEKESFEIEGFKFLGCTLWTDLKLFGPVNLASYNKYYQVADYYKIRVSPKLRRLHPYDTKLFHLHSFQWLQDELSKSRHQKTIVITHHAPSLRSIPVAFRSNHLSAAFASPLDDFVINADISLWLHGHTHNRVDYKLGNTRVVCNPRGYPYQALSFNPELLIEV